MKTTRIGISLLFAGVLASAPARAGIEHLRSCGTEWGGNTVGLSRGINNDVTVEGFAVDLATSVDSTLPNTPVTVLSRKNGAGSNIVIRIAPPAVGDHISPASVNLRYFGGGVDTFNVSLAAGPTVTSVAFAPEPGVSTSGGLTRVTSLDPHVVIIKGTNVDSLPIISSKFDGARLRDAHYVLKLPGEVHLSFKSDAGERTIGSSLYDFGGPCSQRPPSFSLAFTVFDPPRTPTPTVTPTRTPTRRPLGAPVIFTPLKGPSLLLTPTPTPKGPPSLFPPKK